MNSSPSSVRRSSAPLRNASLSLMEILRAAGLRAPGGVHGAVGHHSASIEGRPPMKAAVLYKPNTPLEGVEVGRQAPTAGEASVKGKAAGVCRSDWRRMNGDWPMPPPRA